LSKAAGGHAGRAGLRQYKRAQCYLIRLGKGFAAAEAADAQCAGPEQEAAAAQRGALRASQQRKVGAV